MRRPQVARMVRGFTLIELLVVLALISLLTGLAAFSAGAAGSQTTREARRLAATVRLAADESRLYGRVLGLRLERNGYSYYELLPEQAAGDAAWGFRWTPLPERGALASRAWPPPLESQLLMDGRVAGTNFRSGSAAPQVVFLPDGDSTPFSVRLSGAGGPGMVLRLGSSGQLDIQAP